MSTEQRSSVTGLPAWIVGYSSPVVLGDTSIMHAPHFGADEPAPACVRDLDGTEWTVTDRAAVDDDVTECDCRRCRYWFRTEGEQ